MAETLPAWSVTGQIETVGQTDSGAFVEGVKVTFRTASGAVGSVFIPRTDYNEYNVRSAIDARAAVINNVSNMTA